MSKPGSGGMLIFILLSLSIVIGVVAFWRFTRSDRYLRRAFVAMQSRGHDLTAEQCIDEVLRWSGTCEAMKSLCDASIPRMMQACLVARDRKALCQELGQKVMATQFGFVECKARQLNPQRKTTCALAYREIAEYCLQLERTRLR